MTEREELVGRLRETNPFCEPDNARSVMDEAAAALEAKDAWQPIETAPRDGTLILACNVHHGFMYVVGFQPEDERELAHWNDVGSRHSAPNLYFNENYFQQWQPLPAAPSAAERGKG